MGRLWKDAPPELKDALEKKYAAAKAAFEAKG